MITVPLAQVAVPSQPPLLVSMLPLIFMFGLVYFLFLRPQQKQQRAHQAMVSALKKHDEVVTVGGLHGTVLNAKESTLVLRVDDNVKVEVDRSAIARVTKSADN